MLAKVSPMPPHVLMNFRGFPPGCGDSVADFWGWDAHEARLRCPDDVSGDMQEDEIPGGALSLNLLTTQTMVTAGNLSLHRKISHGRTGNRTRDLMISSQRPWPLDYEAGHCNYIRNIIPFRTCRCDYSPWPAWCLTASMSATPSVWDLTSRKH